MSKTSGQLRAEAAGAGARELGDLDRAWRPNAIILVCGLFAALWAATRMRGLFEAALEEAGHR